MVEFPAELQAFIFAGFILVVVGVIINGRRAPFEPFPLGAMIAFILVGFVLVAASFSGYGRIKGQGNLLSFSLLKKNGVFLVHYQGEMPLAGKFAIIGRFDDKIESKLVKDVPPSLKPGDKFLFHNGKLVIIK